MKKSGCGGEEKRRRGRGRRRREKKFHRKKPGEKKVCDDQNFFCDKLREKGKAGRQTGWAAPTAGNLMATPGT